MFDDVSDRIGPTILFDFIMFSILLYTYISGQNTNPVVLYVVWFIALIVVYAGDADWQDFTKVAGVREKYFGFNILHGLIGIGIVGLFYGLVTSQLQAVYAGNTEALSLVQPLYSPLNIDALKITLDFDFLSKIVLVIWIGFVETLHIFISTKNTTNYLISKDLNPKSSLIISFIYRNLVWALMHFFARGGVSILSIVFALAYSLLFWSPYLVTYFSGLVERDDRYSIPNINIVGVAIAHAFWDLLVVTGFILDEFVFNIVCFLLIPLTLLSMRVLEHYSDSKVLLEITNDNP